MTDKSLPESLHQWMSQEMKFVPQGHHVNTPLPTQQHLTEISRGPVMVDIWTFVLSHIYSAQTVKKVKGNLALKRSTDSSYKVTYKSDSKYNATLQGLLDKKAKLIQERKSLESDIHHLENDLGRLEQELSQTEKDQEDKKENINSTQRKQVLLDNYTMQNQNLILQYKEYINQMQRKLSQVVDRAKRGAETEEYYSRKKSSTDDDHYTESAGLESKCCREVRRSCAQLGTFLLQVLQGEYGTDRNLISQKKQVVWQDVETILNGFSVQQVNEALVVNSQDATQVVREMSSTLDIRKDAEKLRFKFEKTGELKDISSSPSLLSSVNQLLQENYFQQCQRLVETEKYKNESCKLEENFEKLSQQIDEKLHALFPKREDVKLIRSFIDDKILLAGKRAALHCVHEETTELRETVVQSQQQQEMLMSKYRKIHDFQEIADRKQQLIRVLVKQNMNAKTRMDVQKQEILEYCKRSVSVHQTEVRSLKTGLHGNISTEITKFSSLLLPYLMFTESENSALKVAVMDLSIHHLSHPTSITVRPSLQKVLDDIQFPRFLAPESLLQLCLDMRQECDSIRDHKMQIQNQSANQEGLGILQDLCSAVEEQDKKMLKTIIPIIQSRLEKSEKILQKCGNVTERVCEWWEQPGQNTIPWEKVDDNSLQHWKNKWNVLITKLRHHNVNQ